jgi:glyoxylase-like metal-dependent hydrolase (beta-lactamase superfamily II)
LSGRRGLIDRAAGERATLDRRHFVAAAGACLGHLWLTPREAAALAVGAEGGPRSPVRYGAATVARHERLIAREGWGDVVEVADGIWALISTPLSGHPEAARTVSNGGIIAGSDGVLVVEAFARPEGASWMADRAYELTGRRPDRVILTHHHGDHTAGVPGYFPGGADGVAVLSTEPVKDRLMGAGGVSSARAARVQPVLPTSGEEVFDLGGRVVRVVPRDGHTGSDVTVEVVDPAVVFCGDLVWNRLFPNYVHATPSRLAEAVDALLADEQRVFVPGHGPIPDRQELRAYRELIGLVGAAARDGREAGASPAEAAARFTIPERLGEWTFFSDRYVEVAIRAWYEEWSV